MYSKDLFFYEMLIILLNFWKLSSYCLKLIDIDQIHNYYDRMLDTDIDTTIIGWVVIMVLTTSNLCRIVALIRNCQSKSYFVCTLDEVPQEKICKLTQLKTKTKIAANSL